jgi:hypothetical protein
MPLLLFYILKIEFMCALLSATWLLVVAYEEKRTIYLSKLCKIQNILVRTYKYIEQ